MLVAISGDGIAEKENLSLTRVNESANLSVGVTYQRENGVTMKLYVGNLALQTSGEDLRVLFGQAGSVVSATVIEDGNTRRSRCFGFVEMTTSEEGAAAIVQFNGKEVEGRPLMVNEIKAGQNRRVQGRRNFGGGRGGYDGNTWQMGQRRTKVE